MTNLQSHHQGGGTGSTEWLYAFVAINTFRNLFRATVTCEVFSFDKDGCQSSKLSASLGCPLISTWTNICSITVCRVECPSYQDSFRQLLCGWLLSGDDAGLRRPRRINWKNNKQTNNNGTYHLNKRVVIYSHPMKYEVLMNYDTSYWKSRVPSHKFPRRPLAWMRQDLESTHQRNEPIRINLVQWWIVSQWHVFYVLFGLKSRWGKQLFLMSLTSYSLEFSAKIEISQCQPDATNSTVEVLLITAWLIASLTIPYYCRHASRT